ncbi:venom factor-like isoform X3 [Lepidochelys kempii]|uniref:venom factor-like isoform X3 n=1 Tax=Lepidochelys kempii TaxID=8472 RepID=UPI003C6F359E
MYAKRLKSDLVELCRQRGLRIGRSTKEQLIAQLEERDRLDDPIPVPEGSCPGDAAWALGPDRAGRGQTAAEDIPRPFLPMSGGGVGGSPANTEGTLTPAPSRGSSQRSSPSLERRRLEWEREMKMRELEDHEKQRQHEEKQRQHEQEEKEKQRQHEQEEKERERQEKERERQEKERERQEKEKQRQHELELARLRSSGTPAAVSEGGPKTARNFDKCFLAQRKEGEDIDSFLTAFENACELHRVDPADRLQFLTPLLDPKAVEVYSRMTGPEAGDYELFKQALLREFGLTPEMYRRRFRSQRKTPEVTYLQLANRMQGYARKWTAGARAKEDLLDLIVLEQLYEQCPSDLRLWYFLAAPNVLRVGNEENVVLQAQDQEGSLSQDVRVQIRLFDFPKRATVLQEKVVWLSPANGSLAMTTVQVPEQYVSKGTEKQYVVVQAMFGDVPLEKYILISPHTGYTFVQTDKPIYTPSQNVNYRVFAVNHRMDPLEANCIIVIQSPEGITVSSTTRKLEKGLYAGTFHIPEHVSLGSWRIVTRFQSSPWQPHSTEFEVKEYELPSFDVLLTPTKKFFYLSDDSLTIAIESRYVFNEPVDGYALVIFGVKTETQKIRLQKSLQRVEINDGEGQATLTGQVLREEFANPEELLNAFIFVNVTVFSSGGDMMQAENSEVKIVSTPYSIRFVRTPGFFKPGMPFNFRVYVTNPDGSPATDVLVCSRDQKGMTKEGLASMVLNTQPSSKTLEVQVATCGPLAPPAQQATATKTILAYETPNSSGHLLHIGVETEAAQVGTPLSVMLNTEHRSSEAKQFTILLLSKGRIVRAWTQPRNPGTVVTARTLDVEPQLLPSFRIVAFYYLPGPAELVADSVWVDVADGCMGTLRVGPQSKDDKKKEFKPQRELKLEVTGDPQAMVGLVAVDKALVTLTKKNKLTQKKVWDMVEEHDIACTAGSGRNHMGVFTDAGLDVATSLGISTTARTDLRCPQPAARRRRSSLQTLQKKQLKVDQYPTALERRCCEAGIRENPMGHSCEQRTSRVHLGPPCVAAFLDCCRYARALTREDRAKLLLGKTSEDEGCEDEDCAGSAVVRSYFPESWLWEKFVLTKAAPLQPGLARHLISKFLPDSITTWHILAVSLRKDKGLCISEPYEVTVKVPFFIDLRLPFSVVRNEQVEVRAVVYNYYEDDDVLQVLVEFPYQEPLCSPATKGTSFRQRLRVPRGSSRAVRIVVVPLELGPIMVEVRASAQGLGFRDTVRRMLNVQAGGEIRRLSRSIILNPKGQLQQELVRSHHLENLVPDTDSEVFISVQGDLLGETLVGGLQSSTLQKLITLPGGCVEQNIFRVTPNIILTHYLDTTKQWDQIGVELRDRAIQNIVQGYVHQLRYRERDGSYRPYAGSTGSTWLTAYILKVFAMALPLGAPVDPSQLCASTRWLIGQRQEASGCFREDAAIYTPAMQGGYRGSDADASLTAFVLVALKGAESICRNHVNELPDGLWSAQGYLESRLRSLQNPYSVAISSYALALVNSSLANAVLDSFAAHNKTHWPVDQHTDRALYSIEATAYGLLQKLTLGRFEETHPIVRWLVESRGFGGGYDSTQTTVIGMQALAQYRATVPAEKVVDLKVRVTAPTRNLAELWDINNNNAYLQRSNSKKFYAQDTLNITAQGRGTGTVTLLTVYHTLPPVREHECQAFQLAVTVEDVPEDKKKHEYIDTFRLRLQARSLGLRDATMTIIDISLLTGFEPDLEDLKQLTNSVEQYIFLFESKATFSNHSVLLYFRQVRGLAQPPACPAPRDPAPRPPPMWDPAPRPPHHSVLLYFRQVRGLAQPPACPAPRDPAPRPPPTWDPAPRPPHHSVLLYFCQVRGPVQPPACPAPRDPAPRPPHHSVLLYFRQVRGLAQPPACPAPRDPAPRPPPTWDPAPRPPHHSVLLYFRQVSNQTDTEVGFRIHQRLELGLLQPAVATIYEYYEPARRCSRFYNMPSQSALLRKICQEEVCKCAQDNCLQLTPPHGLTEDNLYEKACDTGMDYGTDVEVNGKVRRFVSHATCEAALDLREQGQYLVMGRTRDLWLSKDSYTYVLGKTSFIVPWLSPEEAGTDRRMRRFLQTLENFANFEGCDT